MPTRPVFRTFPLLILGIASLATFETSTPNLWASGSEVASSSNLTSVGALASIVGQHQVSWTAPSCSGASFVGCSLTGQPTCSDWGGAYYPGWDQSQWNACQAACSGTTPDAYCAWSPAQCAGSTLQGCRRAGQPTCTDWGGPSFPSWSSAEWDGCEAACTASDPNSACDWIPATVTGGEFSGCRRAGQPTCTDWGGPSFPNWTSAEWSTCQTACTGTCPAANPNDDVADDAALQACLNAGGTIRLVAGSPGYIIGTGLVVTQNDTTLTSASAPGRARLLAAAGLTRVMLQANNLSNLQISYIELDGNRPGRSDVKSCSGYRIDESNAALEEITGGWFDFNRSTQAVCGSAFQFHGSNFEIAYNLIDNNGHGREAVDAPEPWSDGMTLGYCERSTVHDNWVLDATDVGIVDGGGEGCLIQDNVVLQLNRHAFAGIQLANFVGEGAGIHVGSVVGGNLVRGDGDMSFGIAVGMNPWLTVTNTFTEGGTVTNNTVSGAFVDLMLDGVDGATVTGNSMSSPQGSPACGSNPHLYTVGRTTNSKLQAGWVAETYDDCIP